MSEYLDMIKQIHHMHWDGSHYLPLYIICLIIVFLMIRKNKKAFYSLGIYDIVTLLLVVYSPLAVAIFEKTGQGGDRTTVRVFFILPVYAVIAYALTQCVTAFKNRFVRVALLLIGCLVIAFAGNTYQNTPNVTKIGENRYKISDSERDIARILETDQPEGDIRVLVDINGVDSYGALYENSGRWDTLAVGLRSYSYRIKIPDGFNGVAVYDVANNNGENGEAALMGYLRDLESIDYTYLCIYNRDDVVQVCNEYGFDTIGSCSEYTILRKKVLPESEQISNIDKKTVHIDGLSKDYKIVVLNDMHLICPDTTVKADQWDWMKNRYATFSVNSKGIQSSLRWKRVAQEVNAMHPDLVVMAGDMVDYISEHNIGCLQQGIAEISAPIMYIRSDHDYNTGWSNYSDEDAHTLQSNLMQDPDVWNVDMGEFQVLGINNSVAQITDAQLSELKDYLHNGKPTIIATHVPYASRLNDDLINKADEVRGYADFWAADKKPDDNTQTYLDMICTNDSSVKAVLAGHLHFAYETQLTKNLPEYVFAPGYAGSIGEVTVTSK